MCFTAIDGESPTTRETFFPSRFSSASINSRGETVLYTIWSCRTLRSFHLLQADVKADRPAGGSDPVRSCDPVYCVISKSLVIVWLNQGMQSPERGTAIESTITVISDVIGWNSMS